jgi:hypothetical protein
MIKLCIANEKLIIQKILHKLENWGETLRRGMALICKGEIEFGDMATVTYIGELFKSKRIQAAVKVDFRVIQENAMNEAVENNVEVNPKYLVQTFTEGLLVKFGIYNFIRCVVDIPDVLVDS